MVFDDRRGCQNDAENSAQKSEGAGKLEVEALRTATEDVVILLQLGLGLLSPLLAHMQLVVVIVRVYGTIGAFKKLDFIIIILDYSRSVFVFFESVVLAAATDLATELHLSTIIIVY